MGTFEIQDWLDRGQKLLDRSHSVLAGAPDEKVHDLAASLPTHPYEEHQELRVVFAGQYSAGKSTLLRVLTGREDIPTGAGVTTTTVQELDWNGIKLLDTPGVHTDLHPDHDALTYEAISRADLLVFVITNELFDSYLGEHFQRLAVHRGKGPEMMLVVNKMQRSATGNSWDAQNVITEDLRKVLDPYTPEQMRISFVDAESALESLSENESEIRDALWYESGFDGFVDQLNAFVRSEGLAFRFTTGLYTGEQVLQEALATIPSGDPDLDAAIELLTQKRQALVQGRAAINAAFNDRTNSTAVLIRAEGEKLAELVTGSAGPEHFKAAENTANDRVQKWCDDLDVALQEVIDECGQELDERFEAIQTSGLSVNLRERLEASVHHGSSDPMGWKAAALVSEKLGQLLFSTARDGSAASRGLFSLRAASGSGAHSAVKTVGHFLRYKFSPWQAVKVARGIGAVGTFLSIAGPLLSSALEIKVEIDASQRERELQAARDEVRAHFEECAHQVELHFSHAKNDFLKGEFEELLSKVSSNLDELRGHSKRRDETSAAIERLISEMHSLIGEMRAA